MDYFLNFKNFSGFYNYNTFLNLKEHVVTTINLSFFQKLI
jgi:hypothetical protein